LIFCLAGKLKKSRKRLKPIPAPTAVSITYWESIEKKRPLTLNGIIPVIQPIHALLAIDSRETLRKKRRRKA